MRPGNGVGNIRALESRSFGLLARLLDERFE
jgi:hypothetical protein